DALRVALGLVDELMFALGGADMRGDDEQENQRDRELPEPCHPEVLRRICVTGCSMIVYPGALLAAMAVDSRTTRCVGSFSATRSIFPCSRSTIRSHASAPTS